MTELNTPILPPSAAQPSRWKIPDAFLPKSIVCLRKGYGREFFFSDLGAGLTVAIIALPLSLALAIGSGVRPEQGLFTAIVAGFLVSAAGRQPGADRRTRRRVHGHRRRHRRSTGI